MQSLEIIESIGLELEFSSVDRNSNEFVRAFRKMLPRYERRHDASCESPIETFADVPIAFASNDDRKLLTPYCARNVIGGEIVSPIINSNEPNWVQEVRGLCNLLQTFGETEESSRDSFHVHVNVSREIPLFALKNLLILAGAYEAILFRLGGMGRENRGQENSFVYQRPFLGNGPPIVTNKIDKRIRNVPILDFDDLLKSKTRTEFFNKYGDALFYSEHGSKYVTMRYMVVNFYPVLTQGSFEFRTANKTLNPAYIIAWTNLCKAFVNKAFSNKDISKIIDVRRPLYENRFITLGEFTESMELFSILDDETLSILQEIWERSESPYFDNIPRYSHLPEPTNFRTVSHAPKPLEDTVDVKRAEIIDYHGLARDGRHNEVNIGQFGAIRKLILPPEPYDANKYTRIKEVRLRGGSINLSEFKWEYERYGLEFRVQCIGFVLYVMARDRHRASIDVYGPNDEMVCRVDIDDTFSVDIIEFIYNNGGYNILKTDAELEENDRRRDEMNEQFRVRARIRQVDDIPEPDIELFEDHEPDELNEEEDW